MNYFARYHPFSQQQESVMALLPFKPRGHWVVVERDKEETVTKGGLAIPERHRVKMSRGKVLAIGDGCYENGVWIPVRGVATGDIVQWASAGDTDITVQGKVYTFVPANTIVLIEKPIIYEDSISSGGL